MYSSNKQEIECPSCKKSFFPEHQVALKTICGEELNCTPPGEKYKAPDCEIYEFCSNECAYEFAAKLPTCVYVPGWKRLMLKINKVSSESGIAGTKTHELHKYNK